MNNHNLSFDKERKNKRGGRKEMKGEGRGKCVWFKCFKSIKRIDWFFNLFADIVYLLYKTKALAPEPSIYQKMNKNVLFN